MAFEVLGYGLDAFEVEVGVADMFVFVVFGGGGFKSEESLVVFELFCEFDEAIRDVSLLVMVRATPGDDCLKALAKMLSALLIEDVLPCATPPDYGAPTGPAEEEPVEEHYLNALLVEGHATHMPLTT